MQLCVSIDMHYPIENIEKSKEKRFPFVFNILLKLTTFKMSIVQTLVRLTLWQIMLISCDAYKFHDKSILNVTHVHQER